MVKQRGYKDWLIQRFSAVFIGIYVLMLLGYVLSQPSITYPLWHSLFQNVAVRIFTLLTLLAIVWHAWIGLWTVLTDYVKPKVLRFVCEVIVAGLLISYLVWGFLSLWV